MKLSGMKRADDALAEDLQDPAFRQEWERTALARQVAIRVTQYRAEHGLTQSELARRLGMKQPAIARLEAGDHEPSLATLQRLAQGLGMSFRIEITPQGIDQVAV
jgi:DNA-binding XRE family transcriptional regulator